ncbi:MAG: hypothetical protein MH252_10040 [Thermosynechococcaceae cyanobacterium MS004]|nr:hypothetical protein [Thermosynechococcaceae cyanobacterium MS004]
MIVPLQKMVQLLVGSESLLASKLVALKLTTVADEALKIDLGVYRASPSMIFWRSPCLDSGRQVMLWCLGSPPFS